MKQILFISLSLLISISTIGQTKLQEITGKVSDRESGKIINDATVQLYDKSDKLICILKTDESGLYNIKVAEDVSFIKVKALGYNEAEVSYFKDTNRYGGTTETNFLLDALGKDSKQGIVGQCGLKGDLPVIYFDFNSSYFNEKNKQELKIVGKYLRDNPQIRIRIHGHSDKSGSDKYNDWLSERRVGRIVTWLEKKEGISLDRMETHYYGKRNISNLQADKQWKNRNCNFEVIK